MEIKSKFITIPNIIVNDNEISVNSKYLYGWIYNEIFYGEFKHNMNDITELLNCSITTARKSLKELKNKRYIKIEIINGNERKITPLISDSMILRQYEHTKLNEKYNAKNTIENQEKNKEIFKEKETPKFVKDFIQKVK